MSIISVTVSAKSIVVLGDSISAGYGIEVGQGWVSLLQTKLASEKQSHQIFNESISGDTTAGGLARLSSIFSRLQPDIIIIELGANDGLRGLSPMLIKTNLREIIQRSKLAGAQVLLLSMRIPPNYGKRYTDMFYTIYKSLSVEQNVPFVPFILEDVALAEDMMQQDGLHPNGQAQSIIADKIETYLLPLLK